MSKVELLHGWYSLHDFRRFDREKYLASSNEQKNMFKSSLLSYWEGAEKRQSLGEGSFAIYEIIGHKADLLFLNLGENIECLTKIENQMASFSLASTLERSYSYFGVVELSNYVVSEEKRLEQLEAIERRLKPILPNRKSVCFYPMSKKREGQDNWYSLSMEERQKLMRSHGSVGRMHADVVTQMISGSIGFDEFEWGVTLFADDPLSFKNVVTQMRFDEVSARFAVFGNFFVGNRLSKEKLLDWFDLPRG